MNMTRSEHMKWCKQRALQELDFGGPSEALASIVSDLEKHEDTKSLCSFAFGLGMLEAKRGKETMRRFIEGFAE